ncbi:HNH endonuclease [Thalassospira xiamenensis]|nr:HNH endonuclease signature motif containing protein [Thalassospira xiamenensis]
MKYLDFPLESPKQDDASCFKQANNKVSLMSDLRPCFREPIPEIAIAAQYLDAAVTAHLKGEHEQAATLIKRADMPVIRDWTESIWGKNSPYVSSGRISGAAPVLTKEQRVAARMPNALEKKHLHERDAFHCRFCGIPVIRKEVRAKLAILYPESLKWGRKSTEQHAAFQAMWLQYDHVIPYARGGNNDLDNLVITCAPCNFGRMNFLIEEVGLLDPRTREPLRSSWDGLERLMT